MAIKNGWPLKGLKLLPIKSLQAVVSSSTSSHKPDTFWLRKEQPPVSPSPPAPSHPFPHSTDDQTKARVNFSWHVKSYFDLLSIASWLASNKLLWKRKCNTEVMQLVHRIFLRRTTSDIPSCCLQWPELHLNLESSFYVTHGYTETDSWTCTDDVFRSRMSLLTWLLHTCSMV